MKKDTGGDRINFRIPKGNNLKRRLAAAVEITGVPEAVLVLRATEALVDYIERNNAVTFPISVEAADRITRSQPARASAIITARSDCAKAM